MLGSLIVYLKGMRIMMFQLSGYYCRLPGLASFRGLKRLGGWILQDVGLEVYTRSLQNPFN